MLVNLTELFGFHFILWKSFIDRFDTYLNCCVNLILQAFLSLTVLGAERDAFTVSCWRRRQYWRAFYKSYVFYYCSSYVVIMNIKTACLNRSTQPCIPPGSLNWVPASAGVKAGFSPLPGGR